MSADTAERDAAAAAADALVRALADATSYGAQRVTMVSGRPRYWHIYQWEGLPGFRKTISGSTRERKPPSVTFSHDLLPGWEYTRDELPELIEDLRNIARGRGQPTAPTRGGGKGRKHNAEALPVAPDPPPPPRQPKLF